MRPFAVICLCLACWALGPALAYPLPPGSEARAERHRAWRATLDEGERAMAAGRWDAAESCFAEVAAAARAGQERNLLLARALDGLGDLRLRDRRWPDAERLYSEAAELWERFLGAEQPRLAVTLHNLGLARAEQGRPDEARSALDRALSIFERTLGAESAEAGGTRAALRSIE